MYPLSSWGPDMGGQVIFRLLEIGGVQMLPKEGPSSWVAIVCGSPEEEGGASGFSGWARRCFKSWRNTWSLGFNPPQQGAFTQRYVPHTPGQN